MSTWRRTFRLNIDALPVRRYSARNDVGDITLWLISGIYNRQNTNNDTNHNFIQTLGKDKSVNKTNSGFFQSSDVLTPLTFKSCLTDAYQRSEIRFNCDGKSRAHKNVDVLLISLAVNLQRIISYVWLSSQRVLMYIQKRSHSHRETHVSNQL